MKRRGEGFDSEKSIRKEKDKRMEAKGGTESNIEEDDVQ